MTETLRPGLADGYRGQTLAGKYLVEGVLGDGGMGTVVVARHIELDENVAIKLLRPDLAENELVVARFMREGKIAARIRSTEHIVKVRDIGRLDSGVPFMVMELLEGEDLEARLDREVRLPIELAVDLTLQACDALAAAHDAGIVHRDIKPGNLFLTTRRNGHPSVKVLDFGISKLAGELAEHGHRTSAQEIFGSPFYMSPEQLLSSADVDTRADVWSLGVVLYEMITGTLPFEADVLARLHIAVLQGDPIDVRRHGIHVPDELAEVIHGCLQRNRDTRLQSMRQLAEALAPFCTSLGLEALEGLRSAPARAPAASISSEWAAFTEGRSLAPPNVRSIPAARLSQRSIPTCHSEPKLALVSGRESFGETASGKTLTPWANTGNQKSARRKRVGIASALAVLVALGGTAWLVLHTPDAPFPANLAVAPAALPPPAVTAPVAAELGGGSFEILEAKLDAGAPPAGQPKAAGSRIVDHHRKDDGSPAAGTSSVTQPKASATKLPDDRN